MTLPIFERALNIIKSLVVTILHCRSFQMSNCIIKLLILHYKCRVLKEPINTMLKLGTNF